MAETFLDRIEKAKEAHRAGRKMLPNGLPANPSCKEALKIAIQALEYRASSPIAEWCKRALNKADTK